MTVHTLARGTAAAPVDPNEALAAPVDEHLVREHLPLVGHIVNQIAGRLPSHVARDELTSAGLLALVLSARAWDPDRGVPFAPFAVIRIRGAITDELRSMDWASRAVRSRARELEKVRNDLTVALGRTPTRDEVAAALGCSVNALSAIDADVERASLKSLQALDPEEDRQLPEDSGDTPESLLVKREQIGLLRDCIAELPPRLRTIVERYYFNQEKMSDIAADLGVTESRISQLRAEALVLFRAAMRASGEDAPAPTGPRTRSQIAYISAVTTRSSLVDRLNMTNAMAESRPLHLSTA
jgi:RNA polymerase sigma factor for flagellar operon FliA